MTAWENKYINVNPYSRPSTKLNDVKKLILHWTANFGASANNHYIYFGKTMIEQNAKLPANNRRYASAHIFIDRKEALCIVPLNEVAYQANDVQKYVNGKAYRGVSALTPNANMLAIGVEMCVEKNGAIHDETIDRTVKVFAELCKKYKLDPLKDIVRHYDVTGKDCPSPFVRDSSKFTKFKNDVKKAMGGKVDKEVSKVSSPKNDSNPIGTITTKVNDLNVYDTPRWTKPTKTIDKGVYTVMKKVKVDGAYMYKLKSGLYITASEKYVTFKSK